MPGSLWERAKENITAIPAQLMANQAAEYFCEWLRTSSVEADRDVPWTPDFLAEVLARGRGPQLAEALVATVSEVDRLRIKQMIGHRVAGWDYQDYYRILKAPAFNTPEMQPFGLVLYRHVQEFYRCMDAFKAWLLA